MRLSEVAHEALKKDFAGLGMELTRFYINTITMPEELEKRLDQVGGVAAMGGMDGYTRFKAAEALEDAAKSGGNSLAGAGIGLGVGINLGAVMGNALTPTLQPSRPMRPPHHRGRRSHRARRAPSADDNRHRREVLQRMRHIAQATGLPKCGNAIQTGAKFCIECGTALNP